jgi:hypothetical protein
MSDQPRGNCLVMMVYGLLVIPAFALALLSVFVLDFPSAAEGWGAVVAWFVIFKLLGHGDQLASSHHPRSAMALPAPCAARLHHRPASATRVVKTGFTPIMSVNGLHNLRIRRL